MLRHFLKHVGKTSQTKHYWPHKIVIVKWWLLNTSAQIPAQTTDYSKWCDIRWHTAYKIILLVNEINFCCINVTECTNIMWCHAHNNCDISYWCTICSNYFLKVWFKSLSFRQSNVVGMFQDFTGQRGAFSCITQQWH